MSICYREIHYEPASGRFLTPDPIGLAGGDTNLYRYVGNNPVNRVDPLGLYEYPIGTHGNTLNTDQGIQMVVDSYVNEASRNPIGGENVYQTAHVNAVGQRINVNDNTLALSSAEHYLYARGETHAGGALEAIRQTTSTLLYTPAKAAVQGLGLYNNASPASTTQLKWGLKGVQHGVCK